MSLSTRLRSRRTQRQDERPVKTERTALPWATATRSERLACPDWRGLSSWLLPLDDLNLECPSGESYGFLLEEDEPSGARQSLAVRAPACPGGRDVRTVTVFLDQAAGLLRQLVCVAGWLVLLSATVTLLFQPRLDPGHLIAPGAGTLAALQGLTPARAARRQRTSAAPPRDDPQPAASQPAPDS